MRLTAVLAIIFLLSLVHGRYESPRKKQQKDTYSSSYSLFDDDDFFFEDEPVKKKPKTECRGSNCKRVPKREEKVERRDDFEWEEDSFMEVRPKPTPKPKPIPKQKIKPQPMPTPKPKRRPAPTPPCGGPTCASRCNGKTCKPISRPPPCNGPTCRPIQSCNGLTCGSIQGCTGPTCRGNQRPPLRPQHRPNQRRKPTDIPVDDDYIDPLDDDYVDPAYDDTMIDGNEDVMYENNLNLRYNNYVEPVHNTPGGNGNYWTSYEQEDNTYVTANRYEPQTVART